MKPGKNKNKGTGRSSEKYHKRISFADLKKDVLSYGKRWQGTGGKERWEGILGREGGKGRWEVKVGRKVGKGLWEGRFGREGEKDGWKGTVGREVGKGRWKGTVGKEGCKLKGYGLKIGR